MTDLNNLKENVLIVQETIPHYRIPVFNLLAESFNVTVTTCHEFNETTKFTAQKISVSKKGPFYIPNIPVELMNNADVVIYSFNIRYLPLLKELYFFKKKPVILWGIGVTSEQGFNIHSKYDKIRYAFVRKAEAAIFYSDYIRNKYIEEGHIDPKKLFVAHNTLDLKPSFSEHPKKYFLFVGTFKKYKKADKIIDLFRSAYTKYPELEPLIMIGGGDGLEDVKALVKAYNLSEKISFTGSITDEETLTQYFHFALASVSPYQAGLSVLQSMAKGVPFVCLNDAITGGERLNIENRVNGILANSEDELVESLHQLSIKQEYQKELSLNAYHYFKENCSLEKMVSGFVNAINFIK